MLGESLGEDNAASVDTGYGASYPPHPWYNPRLSNMKPCPPGFVPDEGEDPYKDKKDDMPMAWEGDGDGDGDGAADFVGEGNESAKRAIGREVKEPHTKHELTKSGRRLMKLDGRYTVYKNDRRVGSKHSQLSGPKQRPKVSDKLAKNVNLGVDAGYGGAGGAGYADDSGDGGDGAGYGNGDAPPDGCVPFEGAFPKPNGTKMDRQYTAKYDPFTMSSGYGPAKGTGWPPPAPPPADGDGADAGAGAGDDDGYGELAESKKSLPSVIRREAVHQQTTLIRDKMPNGGRQLLKSGGMQASDSGEAHGVDAAISKPNGKSASLGTGRDTEVESTEADFEVLLEDAVDRSKEKAAAQHMGPLKTAHGRVLTGLIPSSSYKTGSAPINAYDKIEPPPEDDPYIGYYDDGGVDHAAVDEMTGQPYVDGISEKGTSWTNLESQPGYNKEFYKYKPPPNIPRELEPETLTPVADRASEINRDAAELKARYNKAPEAPTEESSTDEPCDLIPSEARGTLTCCIRRYSWAGRYECA